MPALCFWLLKSQWRKARRFSWDHVKENMDCKIARTEYCFSNDKSYLGNSILSGKSLNSVIRKFVLSFIAMTLYGDYLERFAGRSFLQLFVFMLKSIRMDYRYLLLSHGVCN